MLSYLCFLISEINFHKYLFQQTALKVVKIENLFEFSKIVCLKKKIVCCNVKLGITLLLYVVTV